MYEDRFAAANSALTAALEQCHRGYAHNRKRFVQFVGRGCAPLEASPVLNAGF